MRGQEGGVRGPSCLSHARLKPATASNPPSDATHHCTTGSWPRASLALDVRSSSCTWWRRGGGLAVMAPSCTCAPCARSPPAVSGRPTHPRTPSDSFSYHEQHSQNAPQGGRHAGARGRRLGHCRCAAAAAHARSTQQAVQVAPGRRGAPGRAPGRRHRSERGWAAAPVSVCEWMWHCEIRRCEFFRAW